MAGATPVADLVAGTVPWLDRTWFVPALGAAEIALGVALLFGRFIPFVCLVLTAHLCGTFLVLVMEPELAFQNDNPLLLITIGEFVVKNCGTDFSRPGPGLETSASDDMTRESPLVR